MQIRITRLHATPDSGFIGYIYSQAVFPLRKFYSEQIFDLVSMNILMLSLNQLPTL